MRAAAGWLRRFPIEAAIAIVAVGALAMTLAILTTMPDAEARHPGLETQHSLDSITYGTTVRVIPNEAQRRITISSGEMLTLHGWAVDSFHQDAASAVIVKVDGKKQIVDDALGERPDVAKAMKNPKYVRSGFSIAVPHTLLLPGSHVVHVLVRDASRTRTYILPETISVRVVGRSAR